MQASKYFASAQRHIPKAKPVVESTDSVDLVRSYLREIGRIPLLTPEQEVEFGTQIQKMVPLLEAKESLANKLRREPSLQEWATHVQLSEAELTKVVQRGQRARDKMIEGNLRLVVVIAKKYQNRGLDFFDLIQEGNIGLQRGAEKFDPCKGYKFSTYAYWWIRQAITRATSQQGRTIRLPVHITEKLSKIKKAQQRLSQKLGRIATVAELATEVKMPVKQVRECLELARKPVSLDLLVGDERDITFGELLEDDSATPEDYNELACLSTDLQELMSALTPHQREVLELRFGLRDGRPMTLAKVGEHLDITGECVRLSERKAIARLRQRKSKIQDYCR